MPEQKYTTIKQLVRVMLSEKHLINCVIDRSGALITDSDVISAIEDIITEESRYMDGFLRGHAQTVPIQPTATILTGALTLVNGSTEIIGVGTAFTTELLVGDEIRLDAEDNIRLHIKSISGDLLAYSEYVYYGTLLTGDYSKYVSNVPAEINNALARHTAWKLWQRRGRIDDNPFQGDEDYFRQLVKDIKAGLYRFATTGGAEVSKKPTRYDSTTTFTMSDSNMGDYLP